MMEYGTLKMTNATLSPLLCETIILNCMLSKNLKVRLLTGIFDEYMMRSKLGEHNLETMSMEKHCLRVFQWCTVYIMCI